MRDEGVHGDATGRKSSTLNLFRWAGIGIRHMHIAKHDAMWIVVTGRRHAVEDTLLLSIAVVVVS